MATRSRTRLDEVAERLEQHLPAARARSAAIAVPFASVGRMFAIGRGPEFATAREIALKLLETCQIAAEPLTATDLAHGPVAALDPLFPVWAVATAGRDARRRRRGRRPGPRAAGATLIASGTAADAIADAQYRPARAEAADAAARAAALGRRRASSSRAQSRARRASTPTGRAGSRRSRWPARGVPPHDPGQDCCVRGSFGAEST